MQVSVFDVNESTLHRRFRLLSLMEFMILGIIIYLASLFFQYKFTAEDSAILFSVTLYLKSYLPAVWLLWACYRFFADKKRCYWLSDREISYRCGWFTPSVVTLPVKRLQHVEIKQGALERAFKLYSVTVLSAGRGFTIPGMSKGAAESLREALLDNVEPNNND